MFKEIKQHWRAYAILVIGLGTFAAAFTLLSHQIRLQQLAVLAAATFYFLWGVVTHRATRHITRRVVWEYLAISILGLVAIWLLEL